MIVAVMVIVTDGGSCEIFFQKNLRAVEIKLFQRNVPFFQVSPNSLNVTKNAMVRFSRSPHLCSLSKGCKQFLYLQVHILHMVDCLSLIWLSLIFPHIHNFYDKLGLPSVYFPGGISWINYSLYEHNK